jgi:hypothetical protein
MRHRSPRHPTLLKRFIFRRRVPEPLHSRTTHWKLDKHASKGVVDAATVHALTPQTAFSSGDQNAGENTLVLWKIGTGKAMSRRGWVDGGPRARVELPMLQAKAQVLSWNVMRREAVGLVSM